MDKVTFSKLLSYLWFQPQVSMAKVGGMAKGMICLLAITPVVLIEPAPAATVPDWRFNESAEELEVSLPAGVKPRYFILAEPARIVLDLPGTDIGPAEVVKTYSGSVRHIRIAQFQPGLTRIVMELAPDAVLAPGQVQLQNVEDENDASASDSELWILRPLFVGTAEPSSEPGDLGTNALKPEDLVVEDDAIEIPVTLPPEPTLSVTSNTNQPTLSTIAPTLNHDDAGLPFLGEGPVLKPEVMTDVTLDPLSELESSITPADWMPSIGVDASPTPESGAALATEPTPTANAETAAPTLVEPTPLTTDASTIDSAIVNTTQPDLMQVAETPAIADSNANESSGAAASLPTALTRAEASPPTTAESEAAISSLEAANTVPAAPPVPAVVAPDVSDATVSESLKPVASGSNAPSQNTPSEEQGEVLVEPVGLGPSPSDTLALATSAEPHPAGVTAKAPQIEFGQPLPIGNPPPSVVTSGAAADVLIPSGTVLSLRYPHTTALELKTDFPWQEVLVVNQPLRDHQTGQVLVPTGTQVLGRFETGGQGSQFIAQAIALTDRNVTLVAESDYVPAAETRKIEPNQIIEVKVVEDVPRF
ncbi:MAG: AMIN domain-containing protein [Cyanothece sp. SIO1E1]|nr:AMIN domain-containing protein [Cyanothece sp. SIO1E1]